MSSGAQPPRIIPASRRRDKPILSCLLCRRRKLKCDRGHPCKACVDRGLSLSCTYLRDNPVLQESKIPNSVHDRIDQLERLVTTLMSSKEVDDASPAFSTTPYLESHHNNADEDVPATPDRVKLDGDTTSYTNSGHWTSILDGITELREHLDEIPSVDSSKQDGQGETAGPDLLFSRNRHTTKQELLAALPQRPEADQLIANYFISMDTAPTILHQTTFLREYHDFWMAPFETSTMWLGLLYAILALGSRFQATYEGYGPNLREDPAASFCSIRMNFYRERVVQCLILADYTKCPPYTVETMLLYFGTEYLRSADTQFSVNLLVSLIVRIAFRMGYHRDPSKFPNISPFRAEMRRRIWLVVMSLDLISSTQVGLPRTIQPFMFDTQEPRNLLEDDIHEHIEVLPASRPETELTVLLYTLVLTRVRSVHARIIDLMNSTSQPLYREIIGVDAILRQVYEKVPESSRAMPAEHFHGTISPTSMRRLYLGLSFLKAELMLHRPYLILGRKDSKYDYSRRVCLNAALEMLAIQCKLDTEIQPGGKLWQSGWQIYTVSWYMSSIVAQDFLLATTILVLDLDEDLMSPVESTPNISRSGLRLNRAPPTREEIIATLHTAYKIWHRASNRSQEAKKVAAAVRLVLGKAGASNNHQAHGCSHSIVTESSDLPSPVPSFDFNQFVADASRSNVFTMGDTGYSNPFVMGDMPTELSAFMESFNWQPFEHPE